MPRSSASVTLAHGSWVAAANTPSTSSAVSPASASAASAASAITSAAVRPGSARPICASAAPAIAMPVTPPALRCADHRGNEPPGELPPRNASVPRESFRDLEHRHRHRGLALAPLGLLPRQPHARTDRDVLGRDADDRAHHAKALVEVDEDQVVGLASARPDDGRRVDGPTARGHAPFGGADTRPEHRPTVLGDLVGELPPAAVLRIDVRGRALQDAASVPFDLHDASAGTRAARS